MTYAIDRAHFKRKIEHIEKLLHPILQKKISIQKEFKWHPYIHLGVKNLEQSSVEKEFKKTHTKKKKRATWSDMTLCKNPSLSVYVL